MEASLKDILKTHRRYSHKRNFLETLEIVYPEDITVSPLFWRMSLFDTMCFHIFSPIFLSPSRSRSLKYFDSYCFPSGTASERQAEKVANDALVTRNWHILGRPVRASCLKLQLLPEQSRSTVKSVRWSSFALAFSSRVASQKGGLFWGTSSKRREGNPQGVAKKVKMHCIDKTKSLNHSVCATAWIFWPYAVIIMP